MPESEIWILAGIVAAFGFFGFGLAYADLVGGARAITFDEEQATRAKKASARKGASVKQAA